MRPIALCLILSLVVLTALPGVARAGGDTALSDHLPKITPSVQLDPSISDASGGIYPVVRIGRTTRITFLAEDPDGEALTYAVTRLPAGATFDPQQGILT